MCSNMNALEKFNNTSIIINFWQRMCYYKYAVSMK